MSAGVSKLASVLTFAALGCYFLLGARLLVAAGIPYDEEGGSPFLKLHPGTYVAAIACALRLCAGLRPLCVCWRLGARDRGLAAAGAAFLFCVLYEAALSGAGGLVMLLDSFLPACLVGISLADMTQEQASRLTGYLRFLILLNAAIALGEMAAHAHLVPSDDPSASQRAEFRPAALYDHPLTGAAATMIGVLLAPPPRLSAPWRVLWQFVLIAALISFGGRAAIAMTLVAITIQCAWQAGRYILARRLRPIDLRMPSLFAFTAVPICWLFSTSGIAERLETHSYWDPSAETRLAQFHILAQLRPEEILFGCSRADFIAKLEPIRLAYNVQAIECFWLVMLVLLGIAGFVVFVAGMSSLLTWLWHRGDSTGRWMIVSLMLVASTSNSLAHKSMLLVVLVAAVLAGAATRASASREVFIT